jgi:ligand-binding sensor domain-containing protein/signal transduction histidine kinase
VSRLRLLAAAAAAATLASIAALRPDLVAAQPDAELPDDDAITFRHLTVENDLPSSAVLDVTQDALGFVWAGTDEGLVRYDGYEVVQYRRTADSTSLSGNVVQVLEPAAGGALWVGTGAGLNRYDPATDRFLRISGLPADDVVALEADGAGNVWVGTTAGLAFVEADGTVAAVERHDAADRASLPDDVVEALYLTSGGDLWVGTGDGLARRRDGAFQTVRPDSLLGAFSVTAITPSGRGSLLLGTFGDGLLSFDPASGTFARLDLGGDINAQNVTDVHEDPSGTVWVGTLSGGLRRLTPGVEGVRIYRSVAEDPSSLVDDDVSALHEDRQGVLWVATYGGLDRFDRARGTAVRLRHTDDPASLASNDVRAVLAARDGMLYVGTDQTLDRSADGRTFEHTRIGDANDLDAHPVRALYEDREGTVWVGTEGAGLHRIDDDGEIQRVSLPGPTPARFAIASILEREAGDFWIGTLANGLVRYDRAEGTAEFLRRGASGLSSDVVRALAEDAGGALWAGTDAGLCRLGDAAEGARFVCLRADPAEPTRLASDDILSLHARTNGSLWVGTPRGLHRLDTRDVGAGLTRYTAEETDLPGDAVYAIVEDDAGFLWLSTSGGLTRFEPVTETFHRRLEGQDAERALSGAAARSPDGQLFFGSERGLLAFYPQTLSARNANPPEVAITGVEVNGQPVGPEDGDILDAAAPVADEIELGPDEGYVTIEYVGLHFSDPAQNTYRYRMPGIVDEWDEVGTRRDVTFPDLGAGRYTFEVQAANADGVWSDQSATIDLVVHPPWWRTWWALLGFAALAVFALVRADRWQRARLLRQERERAERREAELRAETAEAEQRKASAEADRQRAEAAVLKAENERKAAELERTREVEAANAKLAAANSQLETSLRELKATQAQLVQSEKLASLGQLTAGIAHEIKNPLNFVNNFADLSVELAQELRDEMTEAPDKPAAQVLDEVGDLIDDLQENCRRIREHGQRADRIVRSMLLHSRGGSSERGRVDLARFIDEYANLAFHGARANDSDFNVEIVKDFADDTGEVEVVPQEFGRVLINLLTNAFHAVQKRAAGAEPGFAPTVTLRTRRDGDVVRIDVEDNGTGIPDAVKGRIFEPFFTTKPTGEGTGLGLSLAHDIVTGVHNGSMSVDSVDGEGTTFHVALPVAAGAPEPVDLDAEPAGRGGPAE